MNTQEIVAKLWNLCNVLRDDGITYHQYVTELTYILFLKMAKETYTEDPIPEDCRCATCAASTSRPTTRKSSTNSAQRRRAACARSTPVPRRTSTS